MRVFTSLPSDQNSVQCNFILFTHEILADQRGVAFFAFHGNINREISATENGQFSGDTRQPENYEWAYQTTRYQLQPNDILHFWLYVQHDSLGYVLANQRLVYPYDFTTRSSVQSQYTPTPVPISPIYTYPSVNYEQQTTTTHRPTQRPSHRPQKPATHRPSSSGNCEPSITTVNKSPVGCRNELIFIEQFDGDIYDKWTQDVRLQDDSEDVEFVVYENYNNVWNMSNGNLNIYPQLLTESASYDDVQSGSFDISPDRYGHHAP